MTLFPSANVPAKAATAIHARLAQAPPLLVATPQHLHSAKVFGIWSLPDRSTPAKRSLEDQLDAAFDEMTLAQWNTVIGVNLTGQFLCAREAVREFKRRGVVKEVSAAAGKIINAGFEFDVPVRFDTDRLELNLSLIEAGDIPSIPIVEIRL